MFQQVLNRQPLGRCPARKFYKLKMTGSPQIKNRIHPRDTSAKIGCIAKD